jgi:hypothetical protein
MNAWLQPDPGTDATTAMELDAWDAEGGAPGAPEPPGGNSIALARTTERWLLERLGVALIAEWNRHPMPLQRAIDNRAVAGDALRNGSARMRRIARFLHDHKSRGQPGDRP